jgi:tRNA(adenine34) deaminase
MNPQHNTYMERCLELAAMAGADGKTAVGSVIVKEGRIIAEGIEGAGDVPAPLAHAEVLAILKAITYTGSGELSDCSLYTTVEPCFMCSYLIRQTKIKEVVFGTRTNGTGGVSSLYPILAAKDIPVWEAVPLITEGVKKEACGRLLQSK